MYYESFACEIQCEEYFHEWEFLDRCDAIEEIYEEEIRYEDFQEESERTSTVSNVQKTWVKS